MWRFLKLGQKMFRPVNKNLLLFEIGYKMIATAIVYPLFLLLLNMIIKAAGINYLTNEYIIKFITNPFFLFLLLFVASAVILYLLYEIIFIILGYEFIKSGQKIPFLQASVTSLAVLKRLKYKKTWGIIFGALSVTIFVNLAAFIILLNSGTIQEILRLYLPGISWWVWGLICLIAVCWCAFAICGIFTVHIFILKKKSFKEAFAESFQLVKRRFLYVIWKVILYNIEVLAFVGVIYVFISAILILGVRLLDMAYIGSAIYLSALRVIRSGVKLIVAYMAVPSSYITISRLYYKLSGKQNEPYIPIEFAENNKKMSRVICSFLLIASIVLNITYVLLAFNNNPFSKVAIFSEINITAHRGSSQNAPENTMAAFENAITEMADYIELDVQQTKDGAVIIMHDANVLRTTGVNRNVRDMSLEEIKQLDAGSYFSEDFAGEQIPTLEEVIRFAKGKVRFNIEIKSNEYNTRIVQNMIDILIEYDVESDCVITSFDDRMLRQVKQAAPDIEVGYILSAAYGDFYNAEEIDFFSINASFLSKRIVDAIHKSGKQVHAWTINDPVSIKNLANKGVDNIITDTPLVAREVLYSRNTSETLINMLKYVFNR